MQTEDPGPNGTAQPVDILLIEDDDGDAFLVEELLREEDDAVHVRRHRTLREATPDLLSATGCVLLDLHLPDADGLDALRTVLRLAPNAATVVLTGLVERDRGLRAVAAGAEDYLVKGEVDAPLLWRSIRYALERKRADLVARNAYEAELRAEENTRLERGLLPRPVLRDDRLECVVRYRPGGGRLLLGGDFFDAIESADGWLRLMIGDVCGHGPDEAALGVNLRIAWRTLVLSGYPHDAMLPALDEVLRYERPHTGAFVTVCDLAISPDRTRASMSLAGHPEPLLIAPHVIPVPDDSRGPALGILPNPKWPTATFELPPDWRLLLYTDGLVEGRVPHSDQRLGQDGLASILAEISTIGRLDAIAETLLTRVESLQGGPLPDDVAIMLVSPGSGPR